MFVKPHIAYLIVCYTQSKQKNKKKEYDTFMIRSFSVDEEE